MSYCIRSSVQVDDYVIISDGRDRCRAFGQVTGEYRFDDTDSVRPHKRDVRWLWRNDEGVDREPIYSKNFRRQALYQLNPQWIDWDALEAVVGNLDPQLPIAGARPYVLVIDEINRANISKVFGELITLLEVDKRLRRRR